MKVTHYEFALQLLSRDESDGGFVAEAHSIGKLTKAELDLPFDEFAARYLRPAWEQAKAEHDYQLSLVEEAMKLKPGDRFTMNSVNLLNTKIGEA
jgi:hypothetical protein